MQRRHLLCLAALGSMAARSAHALETPDGSVVLTLTGRVRSPNHQAHGEPQALFDMAMLERLPQQSFSTRTPWYSQPRKFTGPLVRDVLSAAMAQGQSLKATALNDYRVDIPVDDVQRYDVLLARLLDDKPMSVRDKGPLFIIYPFDSNNTLRRALYYTRCAWQLKAIDIQ
ncbi:hypothetical protein [Aquabacterium sp.]|uniref:hypothetical protein n=1 Tax=Aquabacterium sp. TaxID=1872578 RepID=UPI002CA4E829|nr:hypothetical protein [Aquabacterium sp.]HSW09040.1 hypothetical protein [Aquabacterium sp.]